MTTRKLEKLFDEWSDLVDQCVAGERNRINRVEYAELCAKRDSAWERYTAAAQSARHHEDESRHDEHRPEWDEMSFE